MAGYLLPKSGKARKYLFCLAGILTMDLLYSYFTNNNSGNAL